MLEGLGFKKRGIVIFRVSISLNKHRWEFICDIVIKYRFCWRLSLLNPVYIILGSLGDVK